MVGRVFHPVPIRVQPQARDTQPPDLPQVHAGPSGGLLVRHHAGFEQGEDFLVQRRMRPDPLQPSEDGRPLIPAVQRPANLFAPSLRRGWTSREQNDNLNQVSRLTKLIADFKAQSQILSSAAARKVAQGNRISC